jgi:hypothetical protein
MKLDQALRIGKECGMETVQEALANIQGHAMNMFPYSEIDAELVELYLDSKDNYSGSVDMTINQCYYKWKDLK